MFPKILIANRGEIAVRVIRACKEMGVSTVAVFSEADRDALHVSLADESICIGPAPVGQSYLNMDAILSAAILTGAKAIHPGYGLLSENAEFAQKCADNGLKFIGPGADIIARMGDKDAARRTMREAGVPVVPGCDMVSDAEHAKAEAERIGLPLLIKARSGGGGRGIRLVETPDQIVRAFDEARAEARGAFGDDGVYMEKYLTNVKHVEMQLLCDMYGGVVCLGDRDCSMQRRHQKMIEESPAPSISEKTRKKMIEAATKAAHAVNYEGVGTIEFLVTPDEKFYFMEMNTRVQVEHPVSEQITGTDIIKEQLRIAAGEPMSCADRAPFTPFGHAMEFRINAEDPDHGFRPCPGKITRFEPPMGPGVRVETYVHEGSSISPYYDSMVAKVIVSGQDREECLARGRRALDEFKIEGIATTLPFHRRVLDNEVFRAGEATTDFIETQMGDLL